MTDTGASKEPGMTPGARAIARLATGRTGPNVAAAMRERRRPKLLGACTRLARQVSDPATRLVLPPLLAPGVVPAMPVPMEPQAAGADIAAPPTPLVVPNFPGLRGVSATAMRWMLGDDVAALVSQPAAEPLVGELPGELVRSGERERARAKLMREGVPKRGRVEEGTVAPVARRESGEVDAEAVGAEAAGGEAVGPDPFAPPQTRRGQTGDRVAAQEPPTLMTARAQREVGGPAVARAKSPGSHVEPAPHSPAASAGSDLAPDPRSHAAPAGPLHGAGFTLPPGVGSTPAAAGRESAAAAAGEEPAPPAAHVPPTPRVLARTVSETATTLTGETSSRPHAAEGSASRPPARGAAPASAASRLDPTALDTPTPAAPEGLSSVPAATPPIPARAVARTASERPVGRRQAGASRARAAKPGQRRPRPGVSAESESAAASTAAAARATHEQPALAAGPAADETATKPVAPTHHSSGVEPVPPVTEGVEPVPSVTASVPARAMARMRVDPPVAARQAGASLAREEEPTADGSRPGVSPMPESLESPAAAVAGAAPVAGAAAAGPSAVARATDEPSAPAGTDGLLPRNVYLTPATREPSVVPAAPKSSVALAASSPAATGRDTPRLPTVAADTVPTAVRSVARVAGDPPAADPAAQLPPVPAPRRAARDVPVAGHVVTRGPVLGAPVAAGLARAVARAVVASPVTADDAGAPRDGDGVPVQRRVARRVQASARMAQRAAADGAHEPSEFVTALGPRTVARTLRPAVEVDGGASAVVARADDVARMAEPRLDAPASIGPPEATAEIGKLGARAEAVAVDPDLSVDASRAVARTPVSPDPPVDASRAVARTRLGSRRPTAGSNPTERSPQAAAAEQPTRVRRSSTPDERGPASVALAALPATGRPLQRLATSPRSPRPARARAHVPAVDVGEILPRERLMRDPARPAVLERSLLGPSALASPVPLPSPSAPQLPPMLSSPPAPTSPQASPFPLARMPAHTPTATQPGMASFHDGLQAAPAASAAQVDELFDALLERLRRELLLERERTGDVVGL